MGSYDRIQPLSLLTNAVTLTLCRRCISWMLNVNYVKRPNIAQVRVIIYYHHLPIYHHHHLLSSSPSIYGTSTLPVTSHAHAGHRVRVSSPVRQGNLRSPAARPVSAVEPLFPGQGQEGQGSSSRPTTIIIISPRTKTETQTQTGQEQQPVPGWYPKKEPGGGATTCRCLWPASPRRR